MTHGQATEFADLAETSDVPTRARPDLRLAGGERTVDMAAAQRAAGEFLAALGIELDAEELRETPARMARAYAELFDSPPFRLTTFPNNEGYDELVVARDIPTKQIADSLAARLQPRGTGVVLEAEHTCMTLRGVRARGTTTITSALLGSLRADARSRAEFLALAGVQ